MDRDWAESTRPADAQLGPPALFIGGDRDPPVLFGAVEPMRRLVPNLHDAVILRDCGHALQQARPQEVTARLLRFARDVSPAK
jgi:pimeloyl-ACP methyl ester carboxylesterase